VELPEASESRFPVLNGHFNIPQSIGGVYVPLYPEQPSSWIANSLCSFSYLSYTHNAPIAELKRLKISTKEALNRFQIFQESHEFVEPDDLLKALTSTDVSSFDYVCDDLGEAKTTRFYVRHFFARQFFALRYKLCGGQFNFAQSLANCMDWKASGGKSRASFLKTLDDRIVLKSISEREFTMFLEVLLSYFTYFSDSFALNKPSCLIPILGMFEVASRDSVGNSTQTQFIVVMPNLFYARKMTHIFDLKGSHRGRFVSEESPEKVKQDGNFLKYNRGFPLSMTAASIEILQSSLQRDTGFLAALGIMDYSLLVGIDEENHEVLLGVIDYFRQYTIDKKLESGVKSMAKLFGKAPPTIIPPELYRQRILESMSFSFNAPPTRTISQNRIRL
jgi:hypothetical protein